ncbi:MAG: hypothetical protein ACRBM6_38600 [Geminicoccales bacterium]
MSARVTQNACTASGCFSLLIIVYLVIGLVVYAAAYGEPAGFSLTVFLVVILWPGFLIWWAIPWIFFGIVIVLACLGLKHIWDGFRYG